MTNPAKIAEWEPNNGWSSGNNLQTRYPYWQAIAAVNQDLCYEFDIVAAFYDPQGQCYYAARTRGCSCPAPWDEDQTEVKGPMGSRRECLQAFRQLAEQGDEYTYDAYPVSQAIDATQNILNHTPEAQQ
ncbi:hypothetical protein ACKFRM_06715 [Corynebacterium sp. YSMAA1_1_D6]|uniref:DUF7574 domain-containing protein n=1 Tax=Corynebacterium sp. YSMAA1_1_D6 TaxID=3383589 RepID=UPI0038D251D8